MSAGIMNVFKIAYVAHAGIQVTAFSYYFGTQIYSFQL